MQTKYTPLQIGEKAFFMPWNDIIIKDIIIDIHKVQYSDMHGFLKEATLYEFKHIQGKYRAYQKKEEIEKALKL